MKPLSLLIVRSAVIAGFILVSDFAITLAQTGQHKPLPTAPLEQYDDPPHCDLQSSSRDRHVDARFPGRTSGPNLDTTAGYSSFP